MQKVQKPMKFELGENVLVDYSGNMKKIVPGVITGYSVNDTSTYGVMHMYDVDMGELGRCNLWDKWLMKECRKNKSL